jgi:hypothetical protein
MAPKVRSPASPEERAALRAIVERRLTAEEFNAYVNAPMSDDEREAILENIAWFRRRYPTAAERFAWRRRVMTRGVLPRT